MLLLYMVAHISTGLKVLRGCDLVLKTNAVVVSGETSSDLRDGDHSTGVGKSLLGVQWLAWLIL